MVFDYNTEEEAKRSLSPRSAIELLGVSEWDGKGRVNNYSNGFLLMSQTGRTYYVYASSKQERDEWVLQVKRALECVLANRDVLPFKPSKIQSNRPPLQSANVCAITKQPLTVPSQCYYCQSCGRAFSSSEYVSEISSFLQLGCEESEKCCVNCKQAQMVIYWLKAINYMHTLALHEMTPNVLSKRLLSPSTYTSPSPHLTKYLSDIKTFKASFVLRRRTSSRLDMAAVLLAQENLTEKEFEELRILDHASRRELMHDDSKLLKGAVDVFGADMQTIIGILRNPTLYAPNTSNGGGVSAKTGSEGDFNRLSFYQVVMRLLEIADAEPELVDFYLPQLLQVYTLEARYIENVSLLKVDMLQQALLAISQKYPPFALKMAWSLLAQVEDFTEKRGLNQVQYGACVSLLLQLELVVTGVVSSLADKPMCQLLASVFVGATHQQQEVAFDIGVLFLTRRRLDEVFEADEQSRLDRNGPLKSRNTGLSTPSSDKVSGTPDTIISTSTTRRSHTPDIVDKRNGIAERDDRNDVDVVHYPSSSIAVDTPVDKEGRKEATPPRQVTLSITAEQAPTLQQTIEIINSKDTEIPQFQAALAAPAPAPTTTSPQAPASNTASGNETPPAKSLRPTISRNGRVSPAPPLTPSQEKTSTGTNSSCASGVDGADDDFCSVLTTPDSIPDNEAALNVPHMTITTPISCVDLYHQLGVGKADRRRSRGSKTKRLSHGSTTEIDNDSDSGDDDREEQMDNTITWLGFAKQLDFIEKLSGIVENLRFVDRQARTVTFKKDLKTLASDSGESSFLGFDPTSSAGEPQYKIVKIYQEECRVFRTKARAPSLLVCEVVRDDSLNRKGYRDRDRDRDRNSNRDGDTDTDKEKGTSERPTTAAAAVAENDGKQRSGAKETSRLLPSSPRKSSNTDPFSTIPENSSNISSAVILATGDGGTSGGMSSPVLSSNKSLQRTPKTSRKKSHGLSADGKVIDSIDTVDGMVDRTCISLAFKEFNDQNQGVKPTIVIPAENEGGGLIEDKVLLTANDSNTIGNNTYSPIPGENGNSNSNSNSATKTGSAALRRSNSAVVTLGAVVKRPSTTFLSANWFNSTHSEDVQSLLRMDTLSPTSSKKSSFSASASASSASPANRTTTSRGDATPGGLIPTAAASPHFEGMGSGSSGAREKHVSDETERTLAPTQYPSFDASEQGKSGTGTICGDIETEGNGEEGSVGPTKARETKVLSSAQRLLNEGKIDHTEYKLLLESDMHYREENIREETTAAQNKIENALGELWANKIERLLRGKNSDTSEPHEGSDDLEFWPERDLKCFIIKTNDDLRQEICCLQLLQLCKEIFEHFHLESVLWLKPYRIVATGGNTGVVQVVPDTISLDGLKKTAGFTTLNAYFSKVYGTPELLQMAKRNYTASLAAYSLLSYILLIKDRHNGNLLIDAEGHILHIDFGFLLSIAPGGSFSLESAPFKLTEEMVEVLGGPDSPLFSEFVSSFTKGFIALQASCENLVGAVQGLAENSSFPCFAGKQTGAVIDRLRSRFRTDLSINETVKHCLDLITSSYNAYGTRQYDNFQWYTNGIIP